MSGQERGENRYSKRGWGLSRQTSLIVGFFFGGSVLFTFNSANKWKVCEEGSLFSHAHLFAFFFFFS